MKNDKKDTDNYDRQPFAVPREIKNDRRSQEDER